MSDYKRRNVHNVSTFILPECRTDLDDSSLNLNAKVPPYFCRNNFDITSPPPLQTFKLSQSQTSSYPVNHINSKQTNIYLIPEDIHNNNRNNYIRNINITKSPKQKRRASTPHINHINQTMSYSASNNYNNYTKRELNEIRMKHYNEIYQIKKKQKRNKNERERIYGYSEYNNTPQTKITKITKKRRHSIDSPIPIEHSYTNKTIAFDININNNKLKKSKTSISRRKSNKNIKYTNQIQIKKRQKKKKKRNKIKRTKSYDTSYDGNETSIYDEDPEIIGNTQSMSESMSQSMSISKQILRINKARIVTFSRRKSLLNGKLIGFESPTTDCIPLMSPLPKQTLEIENEKIKLENEKNKLENEKQKFEKECQQFEILKTKHENEYKNKCKLFELKEEKYETEYNKKINKLLKKEKKIEKQQYKFVKQTEKFDVVIADFYFYQKSIHTMFNKHIILINKWTEIAENIRNNFNQDREIFEQYQTQINEINDDFDEINKVKNELQNMSRPQITKQQSMDCEMRLQHKWRHYLSNNFDEYISPLSSNDSNDTQSDNVTDSSDTQNDNNNSFVRNRNKQHNRSSVSFIKTGVFLDNLNPFWCLKYDSGNDIDDIDEMDLSRNSNSSAVIQSIESIEDNGDLD